MKTKKHNKEHNKEFYLRLYKQMTKIRVFEDNANQLYLDAKMPGLTHMYSGEEAVAVGICEALKVSDKITSTHRGHGHCMAKGANFNQMFCELLGKGEGYCRGKGGSMHIADQANGNLGANAIVGGSMGIATGSALRAKLQKSDDVTVCFFGDGTTNIGAFHEALNMAQIWKLPIVFVCENNLYMEYTPIGDVTAVENPAADRASAYNMEKIIVDGNDADEMYRTAQAAIKKARDGDGPSLIEAKTYRHSGHSRADPGKYRPDEEVKDWMENRDPIINYRKRL